MRALNRILEKSHLRCAVLLVALFLFIPAGEVYAAPKRKPTPAPFAPPPTTVFDKLKARYLTLRNTDVEILRAPEWEELIKNFVTFADSDRGSQAPSALMNAAILYEQLFSKFGGIDRLNQACLLLERIPKEFPGDSLADDALIKCGDFLLYDMHDEARAKAHYIEVAEVYRDGDMLDVARARLNSIASGEYKNLVKASEHEREEKDDRSDNQGRPVIVLDPGHGGEDFGAVGIGGLLEKDVTLDVALELEQLLKTELGAIVKMTRRKDVFVPLAERTALANDFDATLFVSLHNNASPAHKLSGVEVFYLDNTGDAASKKLAERENASLRYEGQAPSDLQMILSDMIQSGKIEDSVILTEFIRKNLVSHLETQGFAVKDLGGRKAPFFVLVGAHMPCVLAEMFFIDNPSDGANLATKEFRREVARGLSQGISAFLKRK